MLKDYSGHAVYMPVLPVSQPIASKHRVHATLAETSVETPGKIPKVFWGKLT